MKSTSGTVPTLALCGSTTGRPPSPDGRRVLLTLGLLLWLAMTIAGPQAQQVHAHARSGGRVAAGAEGAGRRADEVRPPGFRPLPTGGSLSDVLRRFDPPPMPWAAGHRGVDLAAPVGTLVRSPRDGVVSFAGTVAGTGVVAVTHPGTGEPPLRTTYQPVEPLLAQGAAVTAGQIGRAHV